MKDLSIEELTQSLREIEGFIDFIKTFDTSSGIEKLCEDFYEYKKSHGGITSGIAAQFEQVQIQKHRYLENFQTNILYYINPDKKIDESDLDEFRKDWESSKTDNAASKLRDIQRFKTYTEYFLYNEYDADWLLPKYAEATHPLINATLCRALMNAGRYQKALSFMANGLNYSLRYPHLYWHSKYGMIGSSMILWDLAWMISHRKDYCFSTKTEDYWESLRMRVLKLLYMSLTRAIDMAPDLAQTCDLLSNRAELFYYSFDQFQIIFLDEGYIVSREIQYIADKKLAFERACKFSSLGGLFLDKLHESKMMYEYGCLHPMYDTYVVSPKYIEDDVTWEELKLRGLYRADALSVSIYEKFSKHQFDFSRTEIEELIIELRKIYYDVSPQNEFDEVMRLLRDAMEIKEHLPIRELISILDENKKQIGSYECFKHIRRYLVSMCRNITYANSYLLDEICDQYKKIEKNYEWKDFTNK